MLIGVDGNHFSGAHLLQSHGEEQPDATLSKYGHIFTSDRSYLLHGVQNSAPWLAHEPLSDVSVVGQRN